MTYKAFKGERPGLDIARGIGAIQYNPAKSTRPKPKVLWFSIFRISKYSKSPPNFGFHECPWILKNGVFVSAKLLN